MEEGQCWLIYSFQAQAPSPFQFASSILLNTLRVMGLVSLRIPPPKHILKDQIMNFKILYKWVLLG